MNSFLFLQFSSTRCWSSSDWRRRVVHLVDRQWTVHSWRRRSNWTSKTVFTESGSSPTFECPWDSLGWFDIQHLRWISHQCKSTRCGRARRRIRTKFSSCCWSSTGRSEQGWELVHYTTDRGCYSTIDWRNTSGSRSSHWTRTSITREFSTLHRTTERRYEDQAWLLKQYSLLSSLEKIDEEPHLSATPEPPATVLHTVDAEEPRLSATPEPPTIVVHAADNEKPHLSFTPEPQTIAVHTEDKAEEPFLPATSEPPTIAVHTDDAEVPRLSATPEPPTTVVHTDEQEEPRQSSTPEPLTIAIHTDDDADEPHLSVNPERPTTDVDADDHEDPHLSATPEPPTTVVHTDEQGEPHRSSTLEPPIIVVHAVDDEEHPDVDQELEQAKETTEDESIEDTLYSILNEIISQIEEEKVRHINHSADNEHVTALVFEFIVCSPYTRGQTKRIRLGLWLTFLLSIDLLSDYWQRKAPTEEGAAAEWKS